MVAMMVISFFAIGVFGCLLLSGKVYYSSRHVDDANLILQYEIENIRGLRWDEIIALSNSEDLESPSLEAYGDTYSLSREVDSSVSGMRKFNFIVSWNDSEGRLQQLNSGDVIYTENGLSDSYFREY